MKYAVRHKRDGTWLMFQPANRLWPWGPEAERAEYSDRRTAEAMVRVERAEAFSEVVPVGQAVGDEDACGR